MTNSRATYKMPFVTTGGVYALTWLVDPFRLVIIGVWRAWTRAILRELFDQQTTAFKLNCSFGFVLREKESGRLRYYHSSNNCCGRYLEEPSLITNRVTSTDSWNESTSQTFCNGLLPSVQNPTGFASASLMPRSS